DSDPVRFWGCVLDALRTVEPGLGAEAEAALRAPGTQPVRDVLPPLLNALTGVARPIALVLDDYHVVRGSSIQESVEFLVDHAPPTLHLVLATRADPPLPLGRFRVRGQLAELRFSDLRFTHYHLTHLL